MTLTEKDKKEILGLYMEWVDDISEDLDNKSHLSPEEIVDKILSITEQYINTNRKLK